MSELFDDIFVVVDVNICFCAFCCFSFGSFRLWLLNSISFVEGGGGENPARDWPLSKISILRFFRAANFFCKSTELLVLIMVKELCQRTSKP